jgi:hypothetical protein
MRVFHSSRREHEAPWLSFTDLLSNSLILLSLILVFSTISRSLNEKPPVIQLPDNEKFRFSSGGYALSSNFLSALESEKIPVIRKTLACYGVDTLEIIGHTDGQPNSGTSNLDRAFLVGNAGLNLSPSMRAGSNVDLGLLRAISVQRAIKERIGPDTNDVIYRVYSAGSIINTDGRMEGVKNKNQQERRRIEIRFTRSRETTFPKAC